MKNTIRKTIVMALTLATMLCTGLYLTGCSYSSDTTEAVTDDSEASQGASDVVVPAVDYKALAPKPSEFAEDNNWFVNVDDDERYSYFVRAVTLEQFQACQDVLVNGNFPEVVYKGDQTFIAITEDELARAYVFYYPGSDSSESYILLSVFSNVEEETAEDVEVESNEG